MELELNPFTIGYSTIVYRLYTLIRLLKDVNTTIEEALTSPDVINVDVDVDEDEDGESDF